MNFLVELVIVFAIFSFIIFISRFGTTKNRYEYVEDKDEDGNIVEKVIDHNDKGD